MLPPFNEYGLLSPGIHDATLQEIEERFVPAHSAQRRKLFADLREFVESLWKTNGAILVIINGSFVMPQVDGELGPSDIDLMLVLPANWNFDAVLRPHDYNLLSKFRVRKRRHFHLFVVAAGSDDEQRSIDFFSQVNPKWWPVLGLPPELHKGIVKVTP